MKAFKDDRQSQNIVHDREKALREARAAVAASHSPTPSDSPSTIRMPGSGHSLTGQTVTSTVDDDDDDDDDI